MSAKRHTASETARRAAAAAFEALPAVLLAAALLMPALAAIAGRTAERPAPASPAAQIAPVIADQGNRALAEIREQARESLRQNLALPKLS